MTLLASERSLLIRNKFRSVLQLRIQNRKQNEISADSGLKTTCPSRKGEGDQSEALRLPENGATQTSPPSGLHTDTAKDRSVCGAQRRTKPQKTVILNGKAQYPTRSQEQQHKHTLPPENCPVFLPLSSDVFEEDISSPHSSSSPERHALRRSPPFSSSPGLAGDQLLRDVSPVGTPPSTTPSTTPRHAQSGLALLPATEGISQPIGITLGKSNSMATPGRPNGMYLTSQHSPLLPKTAQSPSPSCASSRSPPVLSSGHLPRPQKQQDAKPKMRKLKYHPYIPPNQRAAASSAPFCVPQVSGPKRSSDCLWTHPGMLTVCYYEKDHAQTCLFGMFETVQIQLMALSFIFFSGETDQNVRFSDAVPQSTLAVPATHPHTMDTSPSLKPELLPPNLVDLTVSELRQQLRKRGLPVSGTKPSLLQRLQPFQLPRTCLTPAPLCQLGTSLETFTTSPLLHPNLSPSSSSGSGPDSPSDSGGSPDQQTYIRHSRVPGGAILGSPDRLPESRVPNRILNEIPNGFSDVVSVSAARQHCGPIGTAVVFMDPATTPSETPSPSLPLSSSSSSTSPLQSNASWRTDQELHRHELNVVCEIRERIRHRPRDRNGGADNVFCGGPLHPFLQQDTRCSRGKLEADGLPEVLFTQVFCCQPCEAIGQDLELPVQITASPAQSSPSVRSLEEELQEAIQRAQMDPSQSIDDILDEPATCLGEWSVVTTELKPSEHLAPGPSDSPHGDQLLPSSQHDKDDNFLSSPLCSSLLLELPPSPAISALSHMTLAPPPTILCSSPLPPTGSSRKRKAASTLDAADWLEMLTFGFRPLTPPTAPFVETDFGLDSDLNVNRVLDLMIEQW
ncbi:unnamed protein product [Lota lota]